jgi:hypothetical protein
MTSSRLIRCAAALAAAALALVAPAGAAESAYVPWVTDFGGTAAAPQAAATPRAAVATERPAWIAVAAGVALLGVAGLAVLRSRRRLALALVAVSLAAALAATAIYASGGRKGDRDTVTPGELVAAGWFCVDVPENWVHCVPPGVDLENDPPESMLNLNFYTHDPQSEDAEFLGEETLIRADVWRALPRQWPCGRGEYGFVPAEALPPHGYMYCHHFREPRTSPTG